VKRRALLVRTVTTAASSGVFTAVGWLMGTRTLTMAPPDQPYPPGMCSCDPWARDDAQWACSCVCCHYYAPGEHAERRCEWWYRYCTDCESLRVIRFNELTNCGPCGYASCMGPCPAGIYAC
jgi:hypothetical protein